MSNYTPCKSCKYERLDFDDYPCAGCFDYTTEKYSRWEPKELRTKMNDNVSCVNCRFGDCDMDDYPCCLCNEKYSRWAPKKKDLIELKNDTVASLEKLICELRLATSHYEGCGLHTELAEAIKATWTSEGIMRTIEIDTLPDMVILRGDVMDKFNKLVTFVKVIDRADREARKIKRKENQNENL